MQCQCEVSNRQVPDVGTPRGRMDDDLESTTTEFSQAGWQVAARVSA